jgi:hypothetical protein
MKVVDRTAVVRGSAVGLAIFVAMSGLRVLVDRNVSDFDQSGWAPLFALALFGGYGVAGFVAGRIAQEAPWSNGILAAIGAFAAWIPIRVIIWLVRDNGIGLLTGTDPVFTPARILGQVAFAALFGMLGAVLAARRAVPVDDRSDV